MTIDVDASVGTDTANSYVTVAEADTYFGMSFGKGLWATASPDNKAALVITASRYLDQYVDWEGVPTSDTQSMEWPREGAYNKTGTEYPSDQIPMPVKFATYELAYYLLENGGLSTEESTVDQVKVGSIMVKLDNKAKELGIPCSVMALVNHIGSSNLSISGQAHTVGLVRT